jgi:hypothetical protein
MPYESQRPDCQDLGNALSRCAHAGPADVGRGMLAVALCLLLLPAASIRSEGRGATPAGPQPSSAQDQDADRSYRTGEYVPNFYVRAVTGPLRNKSVCYVCRNGNRPVVMVLTRRLSSELPDLLRGLDKIADVNRAAGLKTFTVFLSNEPQWAASQLQTFGFDEKIAMPLTIAPEAAGAAVFQNVAEVDVESAVTIVLYRNRRVVSNFAFRTDEGLAEGVEDILQSVRELMNGEH